MDSIAKMVTAMLTVKATTNEELQRMVEARIAHWMLNDCLFESITFDVRDSRFFPEHQEFSTPIQFVLCEEHTREQAIAEVQKLLNAWFIEDLYGGAPFPVGSLLYYYTVKP